jgi:hypothetical protein
MHLHSADLPPTGAPNLPSIPTRVHVLEKQGPNVTVERVDDDAPPLSFPAINLASLDHDDRILELARLHRFAQKAN